MNPKDTIRKKLFGTDGVRGVANKDLTPELAYTLGRVGAFFLTKNSANGKIVIGKDTRISGDMLEGALTAGICSVGADVLNVGVMPTPGVAYLTKILKASAGVVISASHNPIQDNGIKFFSSEGFKLPDAIEDKIENQVLFSKESIPSPVGAKVGRVIKVPQAESVYKDFIKDIFNKSLYGLKVVLDCAHGAAFSIAPSLFQEKGAETLVVNHQPNGVNINVKCGSTYPELLQKIVLSSGSDLGIAFDGDADRAIAVDEKGNLTNGDQIMFIFAHYLKSHKKLHSNKVIATVMSNLGLEEALKKEKIDLIRTKVGDRYVLESMLKEKANLGGEQSGHIILSDYNSTGDGIITAALLMNIIKETGDPLSKLASKVKHFPQVLVNIKVKNKEKLSKDKEISEAILEAENILKHHGRILVRCSGTEQIVRVMAEGPDYNEIKKIVDKLAKIIAKKLN